jgi:hypothetical protein
MALNVTGFFPYRVLFPNEVLDGLKLEQYKVQFRVPFMSVSLSHNHMSTAGTLYFLFLQKKTRGIQLFESSNVVKVNYCFSPMRNVINL